MLSLRTNYRRARQIKAELDQLAIDKHEAEVAGRLDKAETICEEMDCLNHEFFLTGASEYDL